ncbi:hypothetical protein B0T25DRAFT_569890 [Lasiosphaeria hispida]|uniref:F-box domain-containing protein n=1 Tax=Lasiosphaeria hispida TaxID=260671 RepID=A0AAJ0HE79_9PEZI|nr:hypothetical protein B0T25DRAFT_569890 [Lasiosphaeria hispida]
MASPQGASPMQALHDQVPDLHNEMEKLNKPVQERRGTRKKMRAAWEKERAALNLGKEKLELPTSLSAMTISRPEPADDPNAFKFLKLPGEMRNLVYHFVAPRELVLDKTKGDQPTCDIFALQRTCRQLSLEIKSFYYGNAEVRLRSATSSLAWMRGSAPTHFISSLRVELQWGIGTWEKVLRSLAHQNAPIQKLVIRDLVWSGHRFASWVDPIELHMAARVGHLRWRTEAEMLRNVEFHGTTLIKILKKFKILRHVQIISEKRDQLWMDAIAKETMAVVEYVRLGPQWWLDC